MDSLFIFILALVVCALGVLLLGVLSGRLALTFRGKPVAVQRPAVWTLGLWSAAQAWADSGNGLLFGAMLLCLLAWDVSPLRYRGPRYTL